MVLRWLPLLLLPCASSLSSPAPRRAIVVGGGAAGVFCAIAAARNCGEGCEVLVLESTSTPLDKVLRSGGGRCNVQHRADMSVADTLGVGYPRGRRELREVLDGVFGPQDSWEWFSREGVELKTEADGRVFPKTDDSRTIHDALLNAAESAGVRLRSHQRVTDVVAADGEGEGGGFVVTANGEDLRCDAVVLCTGSAACGRRWAASLGHHVVEAVPSLFGFKLSSSPLEGLAGVALPDIALSLRDVEKRAAKEQRRAGVDPKEALQRRGPLLITHTGLTGPAALQLSAYAARFLAEERYRGALQANFAPPLAEQEVFEALRELRGGTSELKRKRLSADVTEVLRPPLVKVPVGAAGAKGARRKRAIMDRQGEGYRLPKRVWRKILALSGCDEASTWADQSDAKLRSLAKNLCAMELPFSGRSPHAEEFVTAGGVDLRELNMKACESKVRSGLFFAGEVLNADAHCGGFNFMQAWSTGYAAGLGVARHLRSGVGEAVEAEG